MDIILQVGWAVRGVMAEPEGQPRWLATGCWGTVARVPKKEKKREKAALTAKRIQKREHLL